MFSLKEILALRKRRLTSAGSSTRKARSTQAEGPEPQTLISRIMWNWPASEPLSLREAMRRYPELSGERRTMIELAIQEFNDRRSAGEALTATEFARGFPEIETGLLDSLIFENALASLGNVLDSILQPASQPSPWPEPGQTVAGFRLLELLGSGSFSRVFLAEDTGLNNRRVAVKICRRGMHEADTLADLHHAAIGAVHFVRGFPDSDLVAICMPFSSRTTLMDVISGVWKLRHWPGSALPVWNEVRERSRLAWAEAPWANQTCEAWAMELMRTLAEALSVSHRHNIIHCDIKPNNVLVSSEGQPILVDFNVAFRRSATASPANVGGTLPYMAPEQILAFAGGNGTQESIVPATDIYGLGATIYHLVTGQLPFGASRFTPNGLGNSTADELRRLLSHRQNPVRPVREFNPDISPGFAELIERCVSYDIESRPDTADMLLQALDRIPSTRRLRIQSATGRTATRFSAVAATVLLSVLLLLRPDPQRTAASLLAIPQPGATGQPDMELLLNREMEDGWNEFERHNFAAAERCFAKAMELDPFHEGAILSRTRAALRLDMPDTISSLASILPRETPGQKALVGTCWAAVNNHSLAVEYLNRAIDDGFDTREIHAALGYSQFRQGQLEQALKTLEAAHHAGPVIPQVNLALARVLAALANHNVTRETRLLTTAERMDIPRVMALLDECPECPGRYLVSSQICGTIGRAMSRKEPVAGREWQERSLEEFARGHQLGLSEDYWINLRYMLDPALLESVSARPFLDIPADRRPPNDCPVFIIDPLDGTQYDRCMARRLADMEAPQGVQIAASTPR